MTPLLRPAKAWAAAGILVMLAACSGAPSPGKPDQTSTATATTLPALTGRVVDNAGILSPAVEQSLTARLAKLEEGEGPQMVVVTLPSLKGRPIEAVGLELGNGWGVGDPKRNDGVLLIVAPTDRKVRIEVGRGLESTLTNDRAADIIQTVILPRFKAGDMEDGVTAGTDAVIAALHRRPGEIR